MSSDTRRPAHEIRPIAQALVDLLTPHAEAIEICGSLRRGMPMVGDAEIVVYNPAPTLLGFTDEMVTAGTVTKAVYGKQKNGKDILRWGEKYRGMMYQGVKCEFFTCDADNAGYIRWLRTGPGDANRWIMSYLAWKDAPYRAQGGYWWHGDTMLRIATEQDLFTLLGLPYIEPADRGEGLYKEYFTARSHTWGDWQQFIPAPPEQRFMFDDMAEREWSITIKAGNAGKAAQIERWEWQSPWLLADGRVIVRHNQDWYAASPAHPLAEAYRKLLEGSMIDRWCDGWNLQRWLEAKWEEEKVRRRMLDDVMAEAAAILSEGERLVVRDA